MMLEHLREMRGHFIFFHLSFCYNNIYFWQQVRFLNRFSEWINDTIPPKNYTKCYLNPFGKVLSLNGNPIRQKSKWRRYK